MTNQTIDGVPRAYDVESAARTLAECMDYSWGHMPEQGRAAMREYVALIIAAALPGNAKQPAPVAVVLPTQHDFEQFIIQRDGAVWVSVLSDRRDYNEPINRDYAMWLACLDELKRLNPSL